MKNQHINELITESCVNHFNCSSIIYHEKYYQRNILRIKIVVINNNGK